MNKQERIQQDFTLSVNLFKSIVKVDTSCVNTAQRHNRGGVVCCEGFYIEKMIASEVFNRTKTHHT